MAFSYSKYLLSLPRYPRFCSKTDDFIRQQHSERHFVPHLTCNTGAKFEKNSFNTLRDIFNFVIYLCTERICDIISFLAKLWISLQQKKIFRYRKCHSSSLWKVVHIGNSDKLFSGRNTGSVMKKYTSLRPWNSDKLFFTSYVLQAPLVNSLCFLQFRVDENFDSLPHEDLPTIDMETMATLRDEEVESTVPPAPATRESSLMPATPTSATMRQVPTAETPVGEEVIRTCVTPKRVRGVQLALRKENERHRCAVKLLPYFFTDEELISSNTDGTHGKLSLDSNKLNSLKVLVFSKFPVESAVEKEKLWKFIKTKINDRCRALKFAKRGH